MSGFRGVHIKYSLNPPIYIYVNTVEMNSVFLNKKVDI